MYTRRDLGKLVLAAPVAAAFAAIDSTVDGVKIGAQSYSFRDYKGCTAATAVEAYKLCGLGYAELWQGHLEPKDKAALAAWRKNPPLDQIRAVRASFDDAGVDLYAFNYSFRKDWTDDEIEKGFQIARALGVNRITASSNVSMAKVIDRYARKYETRVAMHNHSKLTPDEFARPDDFAEAMNGTRNIDINLDIGHFWLAGFDPVRFLEQHHDRIMTLHVKDGSRTAGKAVPFGEGDVPIKAVLQLVKTKRYPIPVMLEYEYAGADPITEVKRCYAYCRSALA